MTKRPVAATSLMASKATGFFVRSVSSAASWRPTKASVPGRCTVWSVAASITRSSFSIWHSASCVASLSRYFRPGMKGRLPSQKTRALKQVSA